MIRIVARKARPLDDILSLRHGHFPGCHNSRIIARFAKLPSLLAPLTDTSNRGSVARTTGVGVAEIEYLALTISSHDSIKGSLDNPDDNKLIKQEIIETYHRRKHRIDFEGALKNERHHGQIPNYDHHRRVQNRLGYFPARAKILHQHLVDRNTHGGDDQVNTKQCGKSLVKSRQLFFPFQANMRDQSQEPQFQQDLRDYHCVTAMLINQ